MLIFFINISSIQQYKCVSINSLFPYINIALYNGHQSTSWIPSSSRPSKSPRSDISSTRSSATTWILFWSSWMQPSSVMRRRYSGYWKLFCLFCTARPWRIFHMSYWSHMISSWPVSRLYLWRSNTALCVEPSTASISDWMSWLW